MGKWKSRMYSTKQRGPPSADAGFDNFFLSCQISNVFNQANMAQPSAGTDLTNSERSYILLGIDH